MANKDLNWAHLKALNELYESGHTRAKILGNSYIKTLKDDKKLIRFRTDNLSVLEATRFYRNFYEVHFKENFLRYTSFLISVGLSTDGNRRYDEEDIKSLMFIWNNRHELKSKLTTVRQFSAAIFKGSKYLENHPGVLKAVCCLLDIKEFPDQGPKENQWRLVVDCLNPKLVVLCENLAFLKQPWDARENQVELWYVGGNNTGNIHHISKEKLQLPIYYSCDWDLAGLQIYTRIKKILSEKGFHLTLLHPCDTTTLLPVNSPYLKSTWKFDTDFSGLDKSNFHSSEINLIETLIRKNSWVEEESQDLIQILIHNHALINNKNASLHAS